MSTGQATGLAKAGTWSPKQTKTEKGGTMATQGGFGVDVKIDSGGLTSIANLLDAEFPEQEKTLAEARYHNSTDGYLDYIATGLRQLNSFTIVLGWDDAETTHAQIITSFGANTVVSMSIEDPLGQEVIAFDAHVQKILRQGVQDDLYKCEVLIQPSGAPTIT